MQIIGAKYITVRNGVTEDEELRNAKIEIKNPKKYMSSNWNWRRTLELT